MGTCVSGIPPASSALARTLATITRRRSLVSLCNARLAIPLAAFCVELPFESPLPAPLPAPLRPARQYPSTSHLLHRFTRHGSTQRTCREISTIAALKHRPALNAFRPSDDFLCRTEPSVAFTQHRVRHLRQPPPAGKPPKWANSRILYIASVKRAPGGPLEDSTASILGNSCSDERSPLRHAQVRAEAEG